MRGAYPKVETPQGGGGNHSIVSPHIFPKSGVTLTADRLKHSLVIIAAELSSLDNETDTERTHIKADALLLEAFSLVAGSSGNSIVESYEGLEKWYG
jgi:hypothetical protein